MPTINWDDMTIPRNVPLVLRATNDDGAEICCGICDTPLAYTEDGESSRAFEIGALADVVSMRVDRVHSG